jgi:hypothetical protein
MKYDVRMFNEHGKLRLNFRPTHNIGLKLHEQHRDTFPSPNAVKMADVVLGMADNLEFLSGLSALSSASTSRRIAELHSLHERLTREGPFLMPAFKWFSG